MIQRKICPTEKNITTMQKTWIILASCLCITGCFRTTTVIKGSVIDASMNTVTLQTQENKTYVFSTIETDKSQLNVTCSR